ncbi:Serine/threonine-protein kinase [Basidiobolus ranarum]|uniref:non-specific serine/threonine protein kinase n=1 Tax=Basidiobolus ranarum TaxID=34480 RepID=A0ABR2VYI2_9FUNG
MPHRRVFDSNPNLPKQDSGHLISPQEERENSPQYAPSVEILKKQEQTEPSDVSQASSHNDSTTGQSSNSSKRAISKYQFIKTLGAGSMGKVKLGIHDITGEKAAIKIIPRIPSDGGKHKSHNKDENKEVRIVREAAIMSLLSHPNIVKMKEVVIRPRHYYLIMEYVSGGQMLDYIISHGRLKEKHARKFARQICSAIDYCHLNSIVHRDLKIENILIADDGTIKIIDFGLSNLYSTRSHLSTFCGSLYFAAPELLSAKAYTGPEVDIWSIGIVLYVLVCGRVPFDDQNQPALHAKIKRGHIEYPTWLSSDCKNLISRMLVTNPSQRATMTEILQHPWISKGYDGPPNSYLPHRPPLQLPLNMDIIRGMSGFEFGDENHIREELEKIVGSESYQNQIVQSSTFKLPRSFGGYFKKSITTEAKAINHPLVSIYYLAQEKLNLERIQQEKSGNSYIASHITSNPLPINAKQTTPDNQCVPVSYETGLAEIRKAAAGYFPPVSPNDAPEYIRSQSTASTPTRQSLRPKRSQSFTGGVLRRLSQVMKSGRGHRHSTNSQHIDTEQHLNTIPEVSTVENNPNRDSTDNSPVSKNLDTHVQNRADNDQSLKSATSSKRRSMLMWLPTHSRKSGEAKPKSITHNSTEFHVKPVFLKGLFSVATTSTKKSSVIRADIIRVLGDLGYSWREDSGYFECTQKDWPLEGSKPSTISDHACSSLSAESAESHGQDGANITSYATESHKGTPDDNTLQSGASAATSECQGANGTSSPVKFQISVVKMPWLLGLHGLQFRRLSGHPWEYKNVCQQMLHKLKL